ncbi:MAG: hypothetical protein V1824_00775 [archaeon]
MPSFLNFIRKKKPKIKALEKPFDIKEFRISKKSRLLLKKIFKPNSNKMMPSHKIKEL